MSLVEIVTTVENEGQAVLLARDLVESGLAACANIGSVRSVYRWHGEVRDEAEVQIVFKTTTARADAAESRLRDRHPYDIPAILRLPVLAANDDYANWVASAVSDRPEPTGDENR